MVRKSAAISHNTTARQKYAAARLLGSGGANLRLTEGTWCGEFWGLLLALAKEDILFFGERVGPAVKRQRSHLLLVIIIIIITITIIYIIYIYGTASSDEKSVAPRR
jgi:hypothetical protein